MKHDHQRKRTVDPSGYLLAPSALVAVDGDGAMRHRHRHGATQCLQRRRLRLCRRGCHYGRDSSHGQKKDNAEGDHEATAMVAASAGRLAPHRGRLIVGTRWARFNRSRGGSATDRASAARSAWRGGRGGPTIGQTAPARSGTAIWLQVSWLRRGRLDLTLPVEEVDRGLEAGGLSGVAGRRAARRAPVRCREIGAVVAIVGASTIADRRRSGRCHANQ